MFLKFFLKNFWKSEVSLQLQLFKIIKKTPDPKTEGMLGRQWYHKAVLLEATDHIHYGAHLCQWPSKSQA